MTKQLNVFRYLLRFWNQEVILRLSISCLCALALAACNPESTAAGSSAASSTTATETTKEMSRPLGAVGPIPKSAQRPGDPIIGRRALISNPIVSCGIPLNALQRLASASTYTLPERQGAASTLAYNLNVVKDPNGVSLAASNCLTCHAAPLFGELVIGLGNEFLDFTNNPSIAVEQVGALVVGEKEIAAWEKFADRVAAIAPYVQTQTIGVNPANNLTFALMARRDAKSMQWLDKPRLKPPPEHVLPVSVPPWWRMSKKHAMFSMGEGRGDHASFMMSAAILCTDTLDELQQLDSIGPDIRAFIASLKPPSYPFSINTRLALEGEKVFESTCSRCHGTYGQKASYPNLLVDLDVVGTDSGLIDFISSDGKAFVDWFNESPFGRRATALPSRGYVAPPLDGVWSTAPFLHNGSVPNIRALLNSTLRPVVWRHRDESSESVTSYNQQDLGWHFDVPSSQSEAATDSWMYDTRRHGYANHGHTFGDGLTGSQRDAVLEYLKTL